MGLLLAAGRKGIAGIAVFFAGHILADLSWYSFVSYTLSRSASRMNLKFYKGMLGACSLLLIGFGVLFAIYAIGRVY